MYMFLIHVYTCTFMHACTYTLHDTCKSKYVYMYITSTCTCRCISKYISVPILHLQVHPYAQLNMHVSLHVRLHVTPPVHLHVHVQVVPHLHVHQHVTCTCTSTCIFTCASIIYPHLFTCIFSATSCGSHLKTQFAK